MITRTDILAHLERSARVGFLNGQKGYTPIRDAFVTPLTSDGAFEIYADMGATPWPRQNGGQTGSGTDARTGAPTVGGLHEGGPITILGGNERAIVAYNRDWEVPIGIWHNAINDGKVGSLEQWAMNAGARFEQHMDYLCFNALNLGEGVTVFKGYDGLSLFNDSHIDPGAEYQTAQDNKYAVTLSVPNFKTVRNAAGNFKDDRGQPYGGLGHTLLIHALELEEEAAQVTRNPEKAGTANRDINPYAGKITALGAPGGWLDSTAWYLADVSAPQKPLGLQIRERPQLVYWDDHSQGHGVRYYKWIARYEVVPGDWRLIIQGNS